MTNTVIVLGVFLVAATLFTALGVGDDALIGAVGAGFIAGGWLWRDRFD